MTVSPATTRWPTRTSRRTCGGTSTSIREPNLTIPKRSPARTASPSLTWKTMRRATAPAICLNSTGVPVGCRRPISLRSLSVLAFGCHATR